MAKVLIQNLTKRFDKLLAVNNLNLEVKDGEFVCLLGPSGCGKTTTLRCIAGLENQDEGDIYIGERLINDLPSPDRDIAMVFQFYAIYPGMTVYDNLAFPLKQRKFTKNEIKKKVTETAKIISEQGYKAVSFKMDVTKPDEVSRVVQTVLEQFKKVDVLVNNAGVVRLVPLVDMSDEVRDRIIDVNIKGAFNCIKAVLPNMMAQKYGKIINISLSILLIYTAVELSGILTLVGDR